MKERYMLMLFRLLAIVFICLAVIGGVRAYSPVPFMDMWDGYLNFFTKVSGGDMTVWWAQHNEHRIVLARALFWIDLSWFQGAGWFLIVVNYLLIGVACLFFYVILKEQLTTETEKFSRQILNLLILSLFFSWIQRPNLTQGFQSQFILAQLLPLIGFFLLHRAYTSPSHSNGLFFLTCLTGVISLGTMANGILALPLMTLFALVLRMSWKGIAGLAILAIITTTAYFNEYHVPGGGSSKYIPLSISGELVQYLLLYIGGPFYYITGKGSLVITQLAGLFLIASTIFFACRFVNKPATSSLQLAMLTFLLYIVGTALGTGFGRLKFGVEQALSSRYQTPALMAWAALLVLYAPVIAKGISRNPARVLIPLMLVPLLLLPQQFKAVRSQQDTLFEREVAALALELGIKDQQQISSIFPSADWALSLAKKPSELDLSIFGHPLIKNANQLIGKFEKTRSLVQCQGSLDEISGIEDHGRYVRVRGWLFQSNAKKRPSLIHLFNGVGRIMGYALTGQQRPDVEPAINPEVTESGFKGYLLAQQLGQSVILRGYHPDCELKVVAPLVPYTVKKTEFGASTISVRKDHVVGINE